jgi:ABC-type sugar transport system ATPase subunit
VVRDAAVFLFDEPLSNLDARLRVTMRSELKRLHGELRQTFVYVTHDQVEAMTMADRIAVMSEGRLQQLGTPEDIYYRPTNRFVAEFMGTPAMNFLSGKPATKDGAVVFSVNGGAETIPLRSGIANAPHLAEATIGLRPESIALAPAGQGAVNGIIELVEPLHPDIFVTVDVHGQKILLRTVSEDRPEVGQKVGLRFAPEAMHIFDAKGDRVGSPAIAA